MMNIIDLHCDTLSRMLRMEKQGEPQSLYRREGHLDLERMHQSGYLLQCFAAFVFMGRGEDPYEKGKKLAELFQRCMKENESYIEPVYRFSDIEKNQAAGKLSGMLTIEEGGVLQGSVEKLREFYEYGVRLITLTWNFPNELGYPGAKEETPVPEAVNWKVKGEYPGLTGRGIEMVEAMEEMGVIVDVSHLSDAGFWDVAACTRKPFVASHSNARSVCGHKRNLTDAQIRTLAEHGGVMGLNFAADFLNDDGTKVSLDDFVRHALHIINVGGEDVLALGSDFDGIETNPAMPHCGDLPRLFDTMKKAGMTESVIDKIKGENALRVLKAVLN
ncbi:MAG: dipeptidase [Lachnospiraceae bacterium]|nr:dipeptidase [Lachnospiraceae bacterium]